jgi:hypothetical protein
MARKARTRRYRTPKGGLRVDFVKVRDGSRWQHHWIAYGSNSRVVAKSPEGFSERRKAVQHFNSFHTRMSTGTILIDGLTVAGV